eukprot:gene2724-7989_t
MDSVEPRLLGPNEFAALQPGQTYAARVEFSQSVFTAAAVRSLVESGAYHCSLADELLYSRSPSAAEAYIAAHGVGSTRALEKHTAGHTRDTLSLETLPRALHLFLYEVAQHLALDRTTLTPRREGVCKVLVTLTTDGWALAMGGGIIGNHCLGVHPPVWVSELRGKSLEGIGSVLKDRSLVAGSHEVLLQFADGNLWFPVGPVSLPHDQEQAKAVLQKALAEAVTLTARCRALWDPTKKCIACEADGDGHECFCFVPLALATDGGYDVGIAHPVVREHHEKQHGGPFLEVLTDLMHAWRNPLKRFVRRWHLWAGELVGVCAGHVLQGRGVLSLATDCLEPWDRDNPALYGRLVDAAAQVRDQHDWLPVPVVPDRHSTKRAAPPPMPVRAVACAVTSGAPVLLMLCGASRDLMVAAMDTLPVRPCQPEVAPAQVLRGTDVAAAETGNFFLVQESPPVISICSLERAKCKIKVR